MKAAPHPGLTRRIAAYAAAAAAEPLPDAVVEIAKHHVLDTLGAIISGAGLEAGILSRDYVRKLGGSAEASVLGGGFRTSVVNAALANGVAAHADETDDAHPRSVTHPGCAVVPAAIAMAERERATGATFLRAVVLGYDLCARSGLALGAGRFLTSKGFDSHAFGGVFGAAGAAGSLAALDTEQMTFVLSYAAQQAAGLATLFRDRRHIEKAFVFAGMPARNGVSAATMVQAGMTGVDDVFDGEPSFFSVFGTMSDPAVVFGDLGSTYAITETDIKRWSVGSPIQAALDALDVLVPGPPPAPTDIASIVVHLPEEGARIVDGRDMPSVNVQHLVALRLVDGSLDFDSSHDIVRMNDAKVLEMRAKVQLAPSAELSAAEPARQSIVEIELHNGSVLRHHTRLVRGTARNRMDRDQLAAKAADLMARRIGSVRAAQACDAVWSLDGASDLTQLIAILNEE